MNSILKGNLILGLLCLSISCEQKEKLNAEVDATIPALLESSDTEGVAKLLSDVVNQQDLEDVEPVREVDLSSLVGKSLSDEETDKHAEWIEKLSRNESQRARRERQFAHMRRIEILDWTVSENDFRSLSGEEGEREIEIPFFAGEKLAISAQKIHHYGVDAINVSGSLTDDSAVKVNFNISKMKPVGVVEGGNRLYNYEFFEGLVILLESDPASQDPEYNCDCDFHRAQR